MIRTLTRRTALAATALTGLAATALPLGVAWADDPVRIGFSTSQTGMFAQANVSQVNAYNLWKDQVNAAGGLDVAGKKRPVAFVTYDDQSNPAQTVRIYEKLITDDKVDLLMAPWGTPFQLAIAPVVEKFKFPVVGNSAASVQLRKIKPGYIWFPTSAIPDKMGPALAALMKQQGVTKAAIIASVLPFSKEVKAYLLPALVKEGIKVVSDQDYPPDIKDMTTMLDAAKKAAPDAMVALSYPSDSLMFAQQAKELGLVTPFTFALVGPAMDFFGKALGPAASNDIVTIGHWSPNRTEWPKGKAFYDAYLAKFGEIPDHLDSALAYTSCEILQQAVAKAGLDKEKLRQAVASGTFDTINGPIKFDGVENAVTPTAFLERQGNSIDLVWPASIATAKFQPKSSW